MVSRPFSFKKKLKIIVKICCAIKRNSYLCGTLKAKAMEKQILKHLARAEDALVEINSRCRAIVALLQPHFSEEISVDFQPN